MRGDASVRRALGRPPDDRRLPQLVRERPGHERRLGRAERSSPRRSAICRRHGRRWPPAGWRASASCARRQGRADEARALFERARPHDGAVLGLGAAGARRRRPRRRRPMPPTACCGGCRRARVLDRVPGAGAAGARALRLAASSTAPTAAAPSSSAVGGELATPYVRGRALLRAARELAAARGERERRAPRLRGRRRLFVEAARGLRGRLARLELALARSRGARARRAAAARPGRRGRRSRRWAPRATSPGGRGPAARRHDRRGRRRSLGELTPRELEVLRLVAEGLGDAEIAERLVLSPHTVHRHVANIRVKLRQPVAGGRGRLRGARRAALTLAWPIPAIAPDGRERRSRARTARP